MPCGCSFSTPPRRVNALALQALEVAYLQQHELIDLTTLEMVTADAS
jgi:hypothetical protein